ncbi:MAG: hypothetical protein AB7U29_18135 [Desulfobulbus sp.]
MQVSVYCWRPIPQVLGVVKGMCTVFFLNAHVQGTILVLVRSVNRSK